MPRSIVVEIALVPSQVGLSPFARSAKARRKKQSAGSPI
jgi:hypothetical protein